jgi:diguanylate cyclase (GGDEF)-like protein
MSAWPEQGSHATVPIVDIPLDEKTHRTSVALSRLDPTTWSDADKVALCSLLTTPFALFWLVRVLVMSGDPTISPHVSRTYMAINLPFLWVQAIGHVALVATALLVRRRGMRRTPWLVHLEIQFWMLCASFSLYSVGAFTTPFLTLIVALPILGSLLFEQRIMRFGLLTLGVGVASAMLLPQLGVVPYAPFLERAPFSDGVLSTGWVVSFGLPSVFVSLLLVVVHRVLLRNLYVRQRELEVLSTTDRLTGLFNRAMFFDRLAEEIARARRHKHALCVLMVDADYFKMINDTLGHQAGDGVLRELARQLRTALRAIDIAARYGGEEFAVLLPHTSLADAFIVVERLRKAAHAIASPGVPGRPHVTVSLGVAELMPDENADALMARADAALYEAKRQGRDRAVLADETPRSGKSGNVTPHVSS